jgi:trk system potassium uptake protein
MFAKMAHQLQLFSIMLVLFAILDFHPAFEWTTHKNMDLYLSLIIGVCFYVSLGEKTKLKKIILLTGLIASYLFILNIMYLHPTLGVLSLSIFFIGLSHILNQNFISDLKNPTKNLFVSAEPQSSVLIEWSNILVSYLIYLIPMLLITRSQVENERLLFHAALLGGLSVLNLILGYLNISKNISKIIILTFYIPSLALLYYDFTFLLETMSVTAFILITTLFAYITFRSSAIQSIENQYTKLFAKPEIIVVGYFIIIAVIGSLFLQLPISQTQIQNSFNAMTSTKHTFIDSFFTSISAVCVTGLTVLDTAVNFTFFGQFIILLMIQLGGLGITSLSAWILLVLSTGRLSFSHEDTLYNISCQSAKIDIKSFIRKIMLYFFAVEFAGAFILFCSFLLMNISWKSALWQAIFTSISAFCNAGFALNSTSLIPYQTQPVILLTVSLLIIAGGFAPLMVFDLPKKIKLKRLSLQDKFAIRTTAFLILFGFICYLFVEWSFSLNDLSYLHKITNAWFQSVTTRTAGFNSVDLTETRTITQMIMMMLMFIGGNPGSAAGGIKTVTIAVLFFTAINALRENNEVKVFYKMIPYKTIFKAVLVIFLAITIHFVAFFFLSVTQNIDAISLLFETFSALGTVGLSTGATALLDEVGKIIIIFCMLAGRVGTLTFVLLLLKQEHKNRWKMPEEDVFIN